MALTVKDVLIHDVQVYNGAVHRVEDPSERFFVKILFEGDERQIAMNRSRVSTPMHYCDEELVFPLKEPLQTSGTQSLKLDVYQRDVYQRDIKAINEFIGTLDISLGLLINGRYQSPLVSLKNKEGESLEYTVSVTVEYDDPSSPAKEIHDGSLTLGEVREALWGARYHWFDLGLVLRVPYSTLQVIEMDHRTIKDCFTAMLREWLMISPNPTWSDLVKALRSQPVHRPIIAIRIEDKYIKSDDSSVQKSKDTARSSTLQKARMEAALWDARAKWFELGLALNLSEETLEAIRKNHTVLADRFTAMLEQWLQSSPNPTWSVLVEALRSPVIDRPDMADEIEDILNKIDDPFGQENKYTGRSLTLVEMRTALWSARYIWMRLGVEWDLPYETLQAIERDHRTVANRFTAMLREWLMISPNPTWYELVEALKSDQVGHNEIAGMIEDKYINSGDSSVQESKDTAKSSTLQGIRMEAALWDARTKWFELGLALYLSEETLEAIHKNHTVLEDRFTAMFREWLQSSPNPTWDTLVEALRSPDINRPDIAAEIEDKLIKRDDSLLQENKDTSGSLTLREVRAVSWDARNEWFNLGIVLGVPYRTLKAIQEASRNDNARDGNAYCFTAMLAEWLKSSPNPTWSDLVEALRSDLVCHNRIAGEIEDKYIKSDDSSVQESKDTASSASVEEQLKYEHKLNELLTDTENTINLRYLKLYLIGLSGLGKTTFRKRLLGHLLNLASIPPQDRKRCSTLLKMWCYCNTQKWGKTIVPNMALIYGVITAPDFSVIKTLILEL